jgi:hypothetical protein
MVSGWRPVTWLVFALLMSSCGGSKGKIRPIEHTESPQPTANESIVSLDPEAPVDTGKTAEGQR